MFNSINGKNQKTSNKLKLAGILLCILLLIIITTQSIFAFFSDIVTGNEQITAGTLDLVEDSVNFYINGSPNPATPEELVNINPGDYITFEMHVTNAGSKSAWLLAEFTLYGANGNDIHNVFEVYEGPYAGGMMLNGQTGPDSVTFFSDGGTIINGTYEIEDGSVGNSHAMIYTIYFRETAGNEWQNETIGIRYAVKALQYRNNPTPNWDEAEVLLPEYGK